MPSVSSRLHITIANPYFHCKGQVCMNFIFFFADLFTVMPTPPPSTLVLSLLELLVKSRVLCGWFVFLGELEILVTFRNRSFTFVWQIFECFLSARRVALRMWVYIEWDPFARSLQLRELPVIIIQYYHIDVCRIYVWQVCAQVCMGGSGGRVADSNLGRRCLGMHPCGLPELILNNSYELTRFRKRESIFYTSTVHKCHIYNLKFSSNHILKSKSEFNFNNVT